MNSLFFIKEGGLFDFDLTLPCVLFEFIFLYFFLRQFLFNPILVNIENRRAFINEISNEIRFINSQTESLISKYNILIANAKINLRLNFVEFNQKLSTILSKEITALIQLNQELSKNFDLAILYSMPLRGSGFLNYSFQSELRVAKNFLMNKKNF